MSNGSDYEKSANYQIRIKGNLDLKWSDWFDGFSITCLENETVLAGPVRDQAALHGILAKINDLGLAITSVNEIPAIKPDPGMVKKRG